MKRKYVVALSALAFCGSISAQDIYKIEALSGSDLNGTARYVGMGGAMNALGADLSTMGTNPAAIGLYRKNDVAFTGSATVQPNGQEFSEINKARGSFDQAGFVVPFSMDGGKLKYVNFAFNYQKHRNFKNFIGLDNVATQNGESQSWQMQELAYYNGSALDLSNRNDCQYTTPIAMTGYDAQLIAPTYDADGKVNGYTPSNSRAYNYYRAQWGGIQEYDFNVSFNINHQFYVGATFGVYNVNMHSRLAYDENLQDNAGVLAPYNMDQTESLTGTGFDAKFGLIFRPLEDSPFRIGFSVSTPIFYDLTANSYVSMETPYQYTDKDGKTYSRTFADYSVNDLDYRIRTPWKINLSMATTVSNVLALDAEYEVSRYTGAQLRWIDDESYNWDDWSFKTSTRDRAMDKEIDAYLNTVQTFRIGAEARIAPQCYLRAGYNYVSSPFKKDAYLNAFTQSPAYNYSTNTDYVNLGAINRATVGLGYRGKHCYLDMAYQFQKQQGDVYAFHATNGNNNQNILKGQKVDLNRHNVMFTLGFKF